jgi:hypothetical protein
MVCLNIEFYPAKSGKDFFRFLLILAIFHTDKVLTRDKEGNPGNKIPQVPFPE